MHVDLFKDHCSNSIHTRAAPLTKAEQISSLPIAQIRLQPDSAEYLPQFAHHDKHFAPNIVVAMRLLTNRRAIHAARDALRRTQDGQIFGTACAVPGLKKFQT
jgi:hypothetical protein